MGVRNLVLDIAGMISPKITELTVGFKAVIWGWNPNPQDSNRLTDLDVSQTYYRSDGSAVFVNPNVPRVPEFPSVFLPATMIIGFLGAVLLIQRTRDH